MIRFRNPVSDMKILINNFRKMYVDFSNMEYFNLDNIAEFFAREQLASSSGYIGDEALRRSYQIKDDSRKSMKMQAKSYAELFRFLGWITSSDKALMFSFTYLGIHVAVTGSGAEALFEQCLLGVTYPNNILDVKFNDVNKPFVSMLIFANRLEGKIHRDEILLGPMNLKDGYKDSEIEKKILLIQSLRKTKKVESLNNAIDSLATENNMETNSVRNLTRFVVSALEFSGWFTKEKLKIYGTSSSFLVLTQKGKDTLSTINNSLNLNGNDLDFKDDIVKVVSNIALLDMFRRAGFNVQDELNTLKANIDAVESKFGKREILFSPYQYFSKKQLDEILPEYAIETGSEQRFLNIDAAVNLYSHKQEFLVESKKAVTKTQKLTKKLLDRFENSDSNPEVAALTFLEDIKAMKQTDFYPLVSDLLGYIFNRNAFVPPAGNNNMRYDVMIPDEKFSIPVEVKSPTEEEMLSVKAVRQAIENKVLLLARKPYITDFEISSFACGLNLPNERSDVYKLIDEVYDAYGINIAIMDMKTLIKAALHCAVNTIFYDVEDFKNKRGVINFEN